jgi:chorismate synthase
MANTFGHLFRITTWGESHGGGVGVVVDGCPPRLPLTEADIQPDLDRRRPGQSKIVSPRKESDTVQILSGTFEGKTLGTPICMWVRNEDARPEAYSEMATKFRPSHADYTYQAKFGIRAWPGGGRTSARKSARRRRCRRPGSCASATASKSSPWAVQRIVAAWTGKGWPTSSPISPRRPGCGATHDSPDREDAPGW